MIRLLPIFLAITAFAAAPTNQLVITDTSGSVQTNRPVRIGRPFAKGEIWGHPQPVINGSAATSWQSTVKTRHRDGRSSCTVTGATNEYPITVTCANHGYRNGDYVTISGVVGNTAANGTHRIVRRGRHTFFLQGATGNGAYVSGGTAAGPGPGSVRFVIVVVDNGIDLAADGSVTVTFEDSANACHLGDQTTCEAAALTESQMLTWDSSGWGASIEAIQGNAYTANARTMIDASAFEYWIAGPILTEVIARDQSSTRAYDFGWTCNLNCTGDYAAATWSTDATHKSLSPVFVLSFYDARPNSVRIEYILENMWYGHLQDQRYSLELNSGSTGSTTEYTKAMFTHYAKTRWRKVFWDGAEPGAINIDHDESYLEYSGAVPVWMDDVEPAQVDIDWHNVTSSCPSADFDINARGCYSKYFPTTGGRDEIGIFSKWEAAWLQTFDAGIWPQVWNNGGVSGHIPIHFRDASTDTTLYFVDVDADGATNNDPDDNEVGNGVSGRIFSVDARPAEQSNGGTVATLSGSHGWTVDWAHQAGFAYTPYLVTGEWYLLEEMQFWAAWNIANLSAGNATYARGGSYGLISPDVQTRGVGWGGRNLLRAAWASPDGTVEKEYLTNKAEFNIMSLSGKFLKYRRGENYLPLIGNSDTAPCSGANYGGTPWVDKNPYCYGYYYYNGYGAHTINPLGAPMYHGGVGYCDEYTNGATDVCGSPWMQDYLISAYYGHGRDLGFKTDTLLQMAAKWRFQFMHEDHNQFLTFAYRIPLLMKGTGTFPASPAVHFDGYNASGQAKLAFTGYEMYIEGNYGLSYIHGSLPFLTQGRLGGIGWRDAWNWYTNGTNVENTDTRCLAGDIGAGCTTTLIEARWNIGPRFDATRLQYGVPGSNVLMLRYTAPSERTCSVDVDDDPGFGTLIASEIDGGGGRDRRQVIGGLSPGQEYFYRISCLDDVSGHTPLTGSMTTVSLGGAMTAEIRPGPATSLGATGVRVRSGPAANNLNTDSGVIPCDAGCVVSIPATEGVPVYYDLQYLDGATPISTSAVEAMIP
jgi:hypothetical protein